MESRGGTFGRSVAEELVRAILIGGCGGGVGGLVVLGFAGVILSAVDGRSPLTGLIALGVLGAIAGAIIGCAAGPIGAAFAVLLWVPPSRRSRFAALVLGLLGTVATFLLYLQNARSQLVGPRADNLLMFALFVASGIGYVLIRDRRRYCHPPRGSQDAPGSNPDQV
jgi:hypothetical protein